MEVSPKRAGTVPQIKALRRQAIHLATQQPAATRLVRCRSGRLDVAEDSDLRHPRCQRRRDRGCRAQHVKRNDRTAFGVLRSELLGEQDDVNVESGHGAGTIPENKRAADGGSAALPLYDIVDQ